MKKNPQISLIAAVAQNGVIGIKNKLPWHLAEDLKRFKKLTNGHTIIMGRNTYESIGKPLSNRLNIVISSTTPPQSSDTLVFSKSPQDALNFAKQKEQSEIFIIGGEKVYRWFIDTADTLYLTKINHDFDGDSFFPKINPDLWQIIEQAQHNNNNLHYQFITMKKIK